MKFIIMSNNDNSVFIKSLEPFELGSEFEAKEFKYEEITKIFYTYGLYDDYMAIEV